MAKLRGFSDQATPVLSEFRAGAPAITRATKALGPFAHAATPSLISLGTASAESKQPIANSDPMLIKIRDLAKKSAPGAKVLDTLLNSLRKTGFYKQLTKFLFNTTGGINGYDQYGHFLRAALLSDQVCTILSPEIQSGICDAHFFNRNRQGRRRKQRSPKAEAKQTRRSRPLPSRIRRPTGRSWTGFRRSRGRPRRQPRPGREVRYRQRACRSTHRAIPRVAARQLGGGGSAGPASHAPSMGAARALLDTVIGRPQSRAEGGARDPPRCRRPRRQPDDGRRGHDPDRDPRRLPRLQRQQRPAVRAHLQALRRGAERRPRSSAATT